MLRSSGVVTMMRYTKPFSAKNSESTFPSIGLESLQNFNLNV